MMQRFSDGARLLDLMRRREVMMADVLTTESMRRVVPCVVAHHPQLPETSLEEIRDARLDGRPIVHVTVEENESSELVAIVEKEQEPHIVWSRAEDAPLTHVTAVNLDNGARKVVMRSARFGAGCRMADGDGHPAFRGS
jgi:hypothetical protein